MPSKHYEIIELTSSPSPSSALSAPSSPPPLSPTLPTPRTAPKAKAKAKTRPRTNPTNGRAKAGSSTIANANANAGSSKAGSSSAMVIELYSSDENANNDDEELPATILPGPKRNRGKTCPAPKHKNPVRPTLKTTTNDVFDSNLDERDEHSDIYASSPAGGGTPALGLGLGPFASAVSGSGSGSGSTGGGQNRAGGSSSGSGSASGSGFGTQRQSQTQDQPTFGLVQGILSSPPRPEGESSRSSGKKKLFLDDSDDDNEDPMRWPMLNSKTDANANVKGKGRAAAAPATAKANPPRPVHVLDDSDDEVFELPSSSLPLLVNGNLRDKGKGKAKANTSTPFSPPLPTPTEHAPRVVYALDEDEDDDDDVRSRGGAGGEEAMDQTDDYDDWAQNQEQDAGRAFWNKPFPFQTGEDGKVRLSQSVSPVKVRVAAVAVASGSGSGGGKGQEKNGAPNGHGAAVKTNGADENNADKSEPQPEPVPRPAADFADEGEGAGFDWGFHIDPVPMRPDRDEEQMIYQAEDGLFAHQGQYRAGRQVEIDDDGFEVDWESDPFEEPLARQVQPEHPVQVQQVHQVQQPQPAQPQPQPQPQFHADPAPQVNQPLPQPQVQPQPEPEPELPPPRNEDQDPASQATAQILEIIPNVEPEHLRGLVMAHLGNLLDLQQQQGQQGGENGPDLATATAQHVLGVLFEDPGYPKVDLRKGKGKGKAKANEEGGKEDGRKTKKAKIDYERKDRVFEGGVRYFEFAMMHLQSSFPNIPKPYIRTQLLAHNSLYAPTHLFLHAREVGYDDPQSEWYGQRKDNYERKATKYNASKDKRSLQGVVDEVFEEERKWVEAHLGGGGQGDEGKGKGKEVRGDGEDDEDDEDEDLPEGEGIECSCCFSEYRFDKMVQCPEAHLFCKRCVSTYASTKLGDHDASLLCMHPSDCRLPFPISELRRILPPKLMDLYERVKQQKEIEDAGLEGLEQCPFCEWKIVFEVGTDEEKLFRCGNEEGGCGVVSCRMCKKEDHLPKSCKEVEEDKLLDGRHAIEEAMSRALMRNCPKCKKPFIKEAGCNKMTCSNCHTLSCYVCRKIITNYEHFDQRPANQIQPGPSKNSKCLLWDSVEQRHADEVKAAAEKAMADYKRDHPDVEDDAIKVDVPKAPPMPQPGQPGYQPHLHGAANVAAAGVHLPPIARLINPLDAMAGVQPGGGWPGGAGMWGAMPHQVQVHNAYGMNVNIGWGEGVQPPRIHVHHHPAQAAHGQHPRLAHPVPVRPPAPGPVRPQVVVPRHANAVQAARARLLLQERQRQQLVEQQRVKNERAQRALERANERERLEREARARNEAERLRLEARARVEAERLRLEARARIEAERLQVEAIRRLRSNVGGLIQAAVPAPVAVGKRKRNVNEPDEVGDRVYRDRVHALRLQAQAVAEEQRRERERQAQLEAARRDLERERAVDRARAGHGIGGPVKRRGR